jgi:hypothetical protein
MSNISATTMHNDPVTDAIKLEAWNSPTIQDNIGTKDCMQHLNLFTPFTGWLQKIHVHIRLQQRSPDKTWLTIKNKFSCSITKWQSKVKLRNPSEFQSNYNKPILQRNLGLHCQVFFQLKNNIDQTNGN